MKKVFSFLLIIALCMSASLPAQKVNEVIVKFSKQEGSMRVVLEAEEAFIAKMKVAVSPLKVRIDMPEPFHLNKPEDLPLVFAPADRSLEIHLKEKSGIKFFKLSSPARLVFDIRNETTPQQTTPSDKKSPAAENLSAVVLARGVVIDAGHGGYDFGITAGDVSEKDINLSMAKDLSAVIGKKGKKVSLVRRVDQYLSLADRVNIINRRNPDIVISLHTSINGIFNVYSPKIEEKGFDETADPYAVPARQQKYILKSKALSDHIIKAIREEFKTDVTHRDMPLPILNGVGAPSVLIETPSPRLVTYDQKLRSRIVAAIITGIASYGQQQ